MSTVVRSVTPAAPAAPRVPSRTRLVRSLARSEAAHFVRGPLVWLGVLLSLGIAWTVISSQEAWPGARYTSAPIVLGPLFATISFAVAGSFHRERAGVAVDAPVGEVTRALGRLAGAWPFLLLVVVLTAAGATIARLGGGYDLGDEPGRTLHAHFTVAELLQQPALACLAVAAGAAAGRRFRHRASATLALFLGWFPVVLVSWAFQSLRVVPFSVLQIQPVSVPLGPPETDPLTYPDTWLLNAPGEFQDHWARAFMSTELAAWHTVWLVGLTLVLVSLALPRGVRPWLLAGGIVLAMLGVAMQYAVLP